LLYWLHPTAHTSLLANIGKPQPASQREETIRKRKGR
jgi:hypothetical protein